MRVGRAIRIGWEEWGCIMRVEERGSPGRLWGRLWRDGRGDLRPHAEDTVHLRAVMAWLARAQDQAYPAGSFGYHVVKGWDGAAAETTAGLIPTFLRYAHWSGEADWLRRARAMGHWARGAQRPDGAVVGRGRRSQPVVLATGQMVFAWLSLFRFDGDEDALRAARRAGDWLVAVQHADGAWRRDDARGVAHTRDARVAWSLLVLAEATGGRHYRAAGESFLRWALTGVGAGGWVDHMATVPGEAPSTSAIAHTLEGFWAAAVYCPAELAEALRSVVFQAMEAMGRRYLGGRSHPQLPGRLGPGWRARGRFDCLGGNAHLACLCLRLDECRPRGPYRLWAARLLESVARHQDLRPGHPGLSGGVAGSSPLWGGCSPGWYPALAAKFAADAWMRRLGVGETATVG